ncbi:inovirus Gp2 family protein [Salmonella enterica]|uniref:Prophage protein n=1 Tax=Salmonella enterica I TaxID=59201 RepID=A0A379VHG6_SALET|nr:MULTISPECIES: inovirus Gp2 family protein [Salmonella]EBJ7215706.1 inovirus Gp2 family protein [Salmonella enterica subsp. enterica serovar 3,10:e,h:-]ECC3207093.1 inovirus Gp2 family protein [Salmonella enterica subsp. enterica]EDU6485774.1 inovirus Gp2 family protein [Salmonella enterica subsp. enterica serovar Gaminara]EDV4224639.1 inovirus Gp2 family protein [Salmonella enterica subsp. enterica serovar Duisburg]MBJ3204409.1 inovirus Gp2 family protein [Salmonella enterica subsp. enteric
MLNNICLDMTHSPFNTHYIVRMISVIDNALAQYPRTTAIRIDLHLPEYRDIGDSILCMPNLDPGLMSRMMESLNEKVEVYCKRKSKQWGRTCSCKVRYIWVREIGNENKPHYHAVIFVNNDVFNSLGSYKENSTGLASLIHQAWLSALRIDQGLNTSGLVQIPKNPIYYLDKGNSNGMFQDTYNKLTFRLSYMAKESTKSYSANTRSFGCSQK